MVMDEKRREKYRQNRIIRDIPDIKPKRRSVILRRKLKLVTNNLYHRIKLAVQPLYSEPLAIVLILVAVILTYTHQKFPTESYLLKLAATLKNKDNLRFVGERVETEEKRALGFITLLPNLLFVSEAMRFGLLLVIILISLFAQASTVWQYATTSVLIYLYIKLKNNNDRLLIIGIGIVSAFLGILPIKI